MLFLPTTRARLAAGALLFLIVAASAVAAEEASFAERFDTAWRLVAERYWDPDYGGTDWEAVGERFRPRALAADTEARFYEVLKRMYAELGDDHSVFVPPSEVERIRRSYGDLPCLGVFGSAPEPLRGALERRGGVRYRLEGEVGYVALPDLARIGIASDLRGAVRTLEAAGAKGYVLDLRGNRGGRLIEMMRAAGVFRSGLLWRTLTRWTLPLPYPALGPVETERPLAVLIDRHVHSAAEGMAGALQSSGRARVFGERSAGNVEAVLPFCLRDGSQAWIATGVLAPLRGATWEGRGVEPDEAVAPERALEAALAYLGGYGIDVGAAPTAEGP
jgi:carboxyl-terminal processing protease